MDTQKINFKFYSNGIKQRVKVSSSDAPTFMFQTSDDRFLEHYWNWENFNERKDIISTEDKNENPFINKPVWRKLDTDGNDKTIIREIISALNYNKDNTKIPNHIKENIEIIIEESRHIWQRNANELIPNPVPLPDNKEITNFLPFNKITKYGVTLKRLTHDKIELVRRWRNDPKISQYMEYRDEITPEMQEFWFKKIDNNKNFYFIIEVDDKEIGLINVKDIDYDKGTGEPGIFIWDDNYLNSTYPIQAVCCINDVIFNEIGLSKVSGHVLRDNKRAIRFNKIFGYHLAENQDNRHLQEYLLEKDIYITNRNKLIKYFIKK